MDNVENNAVNAVNVIKKNGEVMTIFYIEVKHSIKNHQEIIKKIIENVKKFTTETSINVKYNHVKDAEKVFKLIDEKTVEIDSDHIYFKLNYDKLGDFKKYQNKCSVSRFVTMARFTPENEEQKNKLLKIKNSFVKIFEVDGVLLFKSRTTQKSHYYLSRQIFNEANIVINNKNFKYDVKKLKTSDTRDTSDTK
jgi:Holliday junction resolvase